MEQQSFTLLVTMIERIDENQDKTNNKLDEINKALNCYTTRTQQLEKKLDDSILIPKIVLKVASIPAIGTVAYEILKHFNKQ